MPTRNGTDMEAAHEVLFNADLLLNHVTPHLSFADFGRLRMTCKELMNVIDKQAAQWRMRSRSRGNVGYGYGATYDVVAPLRATMEISIYCISGSWRRFLWVYLVHGDDTWSVNIRYNSIGASILCRNHWYCSTPPWVVAMCCRAAKVAWAELRGPWDV